jgi:hypothetical protein
MPPLLKISTRVCPKPSFLRTHAVIPAEAGIQSPLPWIPVYVETIRSPLPYPDVAFATVMDL